MLKMIATIVFVITLTLCSVKSISLCDTTVYVGVDQRAENFHTDSIGSMDTDLKYFCTKHDIDDTQCVLIRDYHTKRCFGEEIRHEIDSSPSTEDIIETSQLEKRPEIAQNDHDTNEDMNHDINSDFSTPQSPDVSQSTPSTTSIDYSQSYGPVLPVSILDRTHQLKMFVGETPTKALIRFCGMLKLTTVQCTQVKSAYHELCQKDEIEDIDLENELFGAATDSESASSTLDSGTDTLAESFQFQKDYRQQPPAYENYLPWLKCLLTALEDNWNMIALLIVILYIATEQMP